MELEVKQQDNILVARVTGEFFLEEAIEGFRQLLETVQHHDATKVIIDGLDISGKITNLESYEYGISIAEELHKLIVSKNYKFPHFAYVLKPTFYNKNDLIGETVAANLGAQVKVFENMNEAIEWLRDN